ncbi:MAG: TerB family tellurite resistance protein, partial [Desulfobacterales bacterium]
HDERKSFLQCLFNIANASDMTSFKEVEEIRRISEALKLSHKDFIEAKLTIPRQNREVL